VQCEKTQRLLTAASPAQTDTRFLIVRLGGDEDLQPCLAAGMW
jgi:hypothetical protein